MADLSRSLPLTLSYPSLHHFLEASLRVSLSLPALSSRLLAVSFQKSPFFVRPPRREAPRNDLWSCNPELSFRIARFRLFRVRSPLLPESRLFSFPSGTEMVRFAEFA